MSAFANTIAEFVEEKLSALGFMRDFSKGRIVERDTAALPQTTAGALFTIAGGKVLLEK